MRAVLLLTALLFATHAASADWFRYTPPARGTLIVDEALTGGAQTVTLRLPKSGRYYAELLREGDRGPGLAEPMSVVLVFSVARGKRVLLTRRFEVAFETTTRARTLLWLAAPDTLPVRRDLAVSLTLSAATPAELAATPLRLQISRKPELPLRVR